MPTFTVSSHFASPVFLGAEDALIVTATGGIVAPGGVAAVTGTARNLLDIAGEIRLATLGMGIAIGGGANTLHLRAGGTVGAAIGISLQGGGNLLDIAGTVQGTNGYAAILGGEGNHVTLSGTLNGSTGGIALGAGAVLDISGLVQSGSEDGIAATGGGNVIRVSGTVSGADEGIAFANGIAGTTNLVVNLAGGTIRGRGAGFDDLSALGVQGGAANEIIVNLGTIRGATGAAHLGDGDDVFDGRLGLQQGQVSGGNGQDMLFGGAGIDALSGDAGDDSLSGGAGADWLNGGDGFDLARYDSSPAGLIVTLGTPAVNSGDAAGDILLGIEGIVGSVFDDVLIGDSGANLLHGLGGNDAIAGGAGADFLHGQEGADILFGEAGGDVLAGGPGGDILAGGAEADLFVFGFGDLGDLILDLNAGGTRDGFDLRPFFAATGYSGADPRGEGILAIYQNRSDADVYLYGVFAFRLEGIVAAAITDDYFLFR